LLLQTTKSQNRSRKREEGGETGKGKQRTRKSWLLGKKILAAANLGDLLTPNVSSSQPKHIGILQRKKEEEPWESRTLQREKKNQYGSF